MERRRRMARTLRDAVYGAAVGDALGVPYEFRRRGEFACAGMVGGGAHDQPAGTWSDDTSLLLATCESLRECGGKVRVDDLRRRFCDWMPTDATRPTASASVSATPRPRRLPRGRDASM